MIMIDPSSLSMEDMQKPSLLNHHEHTASEFTDSNSSLLLAAWQLDEDSSKIEPSEGFGDSGFLWKRNRNAETHQFSHNVTGFLMFFAWNSPILTNSRVGSDWKLPIGSPNAPSPQTSELSSCTSAFKRASGVRNWLALAQCASNFSRKIEKTNLSDNSVKDEF